MAELVHGRRDRPRAIGFVSHICPDEFRGLAEFCGNSSASNFIDICHDDTGTLSHEPARHGGTETRAPAGDDKNLTADLHAISSTHSGFDNSTLQCLFQRKFELGGSAMTTVMIQYWLKQ
jgi:hypothetical protein